MEIPLPRINTCGTSSFSELPPLNHYVRSVYWQSGKMGNNSKRSHRTMSTDMTSIKLFSGVAQNAVPSDFCWNYKYISVC